ncbi:MAG TPA: hypothetical protein VLX28_09405 [Thermoanaerobaculia bacterium]|nr:hypothetical protein [Thermoanaerobaculia bacterium]
MADTLWESLCKNAAYKILAAMPRIVREGSAPLGIPPLINHPLPEAADLDSGFEALLCPDGCEPASNTFFSLLKNRLNGLDSVVLYEKAYFQSKDTELILPIKFGGLVLDGAFEVKQRCKCGGADPAWKVVKGTYKVTYREVQIDGRIVVETASGKVTEASARLADRNGKWKDKPLTEIKFENGDPGERAFIEGFLNAIFTGSYKPFSLKDAIRKVIEGPEISSRLQKMIQSVLDQVLGAGGSVLERLSRRLNEAWHKAFAPGSPFLGALPDPFKTEAVIKRWDLPVPIPVIDPPWLPSGNAAFVCRGLTAGGLRTLRPNPVSPHLQLVEEGRRADASIQIQVLGVRGNWALEQKLIQPCAVVRLAAVLGLDGGQDDLDPFRKLEKDLRERGGKMGNWYMDQYWQHAAALRALFDDAEFQKILHQFKAVDLWNLVLKAIQNPTSIPVPKDVLQNGVRLLQRTINYAHDKPVGKALARITSGGYLFSYADKNYEQILAEIATQAPPEAAEAEAADLATDREKLWSAGGEWKGEIKTLTFSVAVSITAGDDGAAPTLRIGSSKTGFRDFEFDRLHSPIAWLIDFVLKHLAPDFRWSLLDAAAQQANGYIQASPELLKPVQQLVKDLWATSIA